MTATTTEALTAVEEMTAQMEQIAGEGDWQTVEQLALRIRNALGGIPESERVAAVQRVQQCIERVQTSALAARHEVTEKLSDIRRGRIATHAYGHSTGATNATALG